MKPRLSVILGHEIRHSVFGNYDNWSLSDPKGANVRKVENSIRRELGLPERISYDPGQLARLRNVMKKIGR